MLNKFFRKFYIRFWYIYIKYVLPLMTTRGCIHHIFKQKTEIHFSTKILKIKEKTYLIEIVFVFLSSFLKYLTN